ncbi:MAG TPA: methyl-accepting chemotaxis protein [Rhodocyclaceae bacterium]|nr:methyl-accepting chemotaxis protein [Rhodocyclaceae bacterium]
MSINLRVKILSAVLILIIAVAALTGIVAMEKIGSQLEDIAETDIPLTELIGEIEVHQLQQEVVLEKMLRAAKIGNAHAELGAMEKQVLAFNDKIHDEIRRGEQITRKLLAATDPHARQEGEKVMAALRKIEHEAVDFQKHVTALIGSINAGDLADAERLALEAEREADGIGNELAELLKEVGRFTEASAKDAENTEHAAMRTLIAVFVLGSAFGAVFAYLIGRSITRPLARMQEVITRAAREKDLTLRVAVDANDEIGRTGAAFNGLMVGFQEVLASVSQTSETVAATAEEMAAASEQVAVASQQQAESASSMAAAVEELTVSIGQITDHANEARCRADETSAASTNGSAKIEQLLSDIRHVAEAVRSSAATIGVLDDRSKEIQGIVNVIHGIAEQTNLLALNAAIEAARAGESGRGFAVVADEVRKLAERSGKATKEIAGLIENVQQCTQQAVREMSEEVREVNAEGEAANEVGQVLTTMQSCSVRMTAAISDVSAALKEQSVASSELARHVEHIAQMTEENNAAVQETATAASTLSDMASRMQAMVGQFRVA